MQRHKTRNETKVSEMILRMAEGFLDMGEDLEHKENLLRFACSAWNIACVIPAQRHSLLGEYVEQFRKTNNASEIACWNLGDDMRRLIEKMDRLYPHVIIRILDSEIELAGGREHVVVTSALFE